MSNEKKVLINKHTNNVFNLSTIDEEEEEYIIYHTDCYIIEYNNKIYNKKYALLKFNENGIIIKVLKSSTFKSRCNLNLNYTDILCWCFNNLKKYYLFKFYFIKKNKKCYMIMKIHVDSSKIQSILKHNISKHMVKLGISNNIIEAKKLFH
tara:strand:+ start:62 stop:514 length:453 start_codon:yes stop_codon:yes gene_type:complete